ncbi:MAG: virulence RhuM family protein, partial [Rikenellaceae bacterium]|nr:virulence RhuM family protein [Rikenellaceae bacterium]
MSKKLQIHNSTAEFLIFQIENKEDGIEVLYRDETLWLTQDAISVLFDKGRSTIAEHLQNIFQSQELQEDSVCRKFRRTAADGKDYSTKYYDLDAVIAVGYRVNSIRATQFRQWCTSILRQFTMRGYIIDRKRMENGTFLGEDYFEHLL